MAESFQLVIGCADPEPLARLWSAALGYELEPPPDGFASWDAYLRDVGVPEDGLGTGEDRIVDPAGPGRAADLFQVVPGPKAPKNRLYLDISVSGGRAVPIETRRMNDLRGGPGPAAVAWPIVPGITMPGCGCSA